MNITEAVQHYGKVSGQVPDANLYATLIQEEFFEWSDQEWKNHDMVGDYEAELKELADLVYVIFGYANAKGWDLNEAVYRVHSNNLGRMYQPDGTILRRKDGKIMKNKDYPKVKLGDLV